MFNSHYPTLEIIAKNEAKKAVRRQQREMMETRREEEMEARIKMEREERRRWKEQQRKARKAMNSDEQQENANVKSKAMKTRERKKARVAEKEDMGIARVR